MARITKEGFTIGGWVAMWRPLEIYLYDWWRCGPNAASRIAWPKCGCGSNCHGPMQHNGKLG